MKWGTILRISFHHQQTLHEYIEKYQKIFITLLVKIFLKFDAQNWMYNTGERFDLFYPSYGDTYPTYNGAVGMTLEQGGIGAEEKVMRRHQFNDQRSTDTCNGSINGRRISSPSRCFAERIQRFYE
jgi:hypothetical protein